MSTLLEILLLIFASLGVLLIVIGVPGNFIPVAIACGYWLVEGGPRFTGTVVLVFLALAASGEVVEQVASFVGVKKFGGSKSGMLGAFVGSIVGGIIGTLLVPVVGTVFGVFLGCFVFTLAFELVLANRDMEAGLRSSLGAVVGKAIAAAYKYGVGFALLGLLVWRFWLL